MSMEDAGSPIAWGDGEIFHRIKKLISQKLTINSLFLTNPTLLRKHKLIKDLT